MASNNYILKSIDAGATVKDYKHAARIFVDSNFRLAPKNAFLFHVAFDVDVTLATQNQDRILEAGLLVKQAGLPRFKIENKTYNAYNRANIVQTKIKYEQIEIKFHDDNADVVRDFWFNYYHYYYRDSDTGLSAQNAAHKYQTRTTDQWGYTPRRDSDVPKMLRSVRIYVLHQKRFTEYLLVNPIITSWSGSGLDTSQGNSTVESTMTLEYEAVIFSSGDLVEENVPSFFKLRYDNVPSDITPRGAAKTTRQAPGGQMSLPDLMNSVVRGYNQVSNTVGQVAGVARDIRNIAQQGKQFKNDIKAFKTGIQDFKNFGKYILQGSNPFSQIRVPDLSNLYKGVVRVDEQVGKITGSNFGLSTATNNASRTLNTSTASRGASQATSNQESVGTIPSLPSYWTSTASGARPPLPSAPTTSASASNSRLFNVTAITSAATVESAAMKSGFIRANAEKISSSSFINSGIASSTGAVNLDSFMNSPLSQDDATGVDFAAFKASGYAQDDSTGVDQAVMAQQDEFGAYDQAVMAQQDEFGTNFDQVVAQGGNPYDEFGTKYDQTVYLNTPVKDKPDSDTL